MERAKDRVNELEGLPPGPLRLIRLWGGPHDGEAWRVPVGTVELAVGSTAAADPARVALYRRRRPSSRVFDHAGWARGRPEDLPTVEDVP